jgi:hypothetical protein
VLAVIIRAFVERNLFPHFPTKESMVAVGAEVFCPFVFTKALVSLEQVAADLAPDLSFLLAIVVVEIVVRSIADRTDNQFRDCVRLGPALDRIKRFTVKRLVLS